MIPLIRQKSFLEKTKKGGWARDVTTKGGPGGHPPRHSHVPPSPPKARAKLFSLSLLPILSLHAHDVIVPSEKAAMITPLFFVAAVALLLLLLLLSML